MSFEVNFESKEVNTGEFTINFALNYIKVGEVKLKYIKPNWFLNLITGDFQYYTIHPLKEQDINKSNIIISCETVTKETKELKISLFEYLDMMIKPQDL